MPRHGTILGLRRPLADRDRIDDLTKPILRRATLGLAHLPRRAQVRHEFLLQHPAGLNEEAAIDRLMRDLHILIEGELALQPPRDLLRRPLQRELLRDAPS